MRLRELAGRWPVVRQLREGDPLGLGRSVQSARSRTLRPRIEEAVEAMQLGSFLDRLGRTLSGGMLRRLEIATALLKQPTVLFLDEPTVGLDPQTRASIWEYIHQLRRQEEITIFLTTHYMDEGRLVALDTPAALKASVGTDRVTIRTSDDEAALQRLPGAVQTSEGIVINVEDGEAYVPELFGSLGVPITNVSISKPSLDDVFLSYTGRTIRDSEQTPGMPAFFAAMVRR